MSQALELADKDCIFFSDKDFKVAISNKFTNTQEKMQIIGE